MIQKNHKSDFVHLHVHSDYSLLDGACKMDRLFSRAQKLGMPALALTDHGNLFGAIDFYSQGKRSGVKPIVGCETYLVYDHRHTEKPERGKYKIHHMGLIAQNFTGYQNLVKLVSESHTKGFYYKPRIDMEYLAAHSEGLIGFTGCLQGVIPQFLLAGAFDKAKEAMHRFISIFGKDRYLVEIQEHGIDLQKQITQPLLDLAQGFGLRVVCTNDVHYVEKTDWAPHDSLLCIQTGSKLADEKRMRYSSQEFYLKSADEMEQLFGEVKGALSNTLLVAEMCDLVLPFGQNHYPVFKRSKESEAQFPSNSDYLKHLCIDGLKERYGFDYTTPGTHPMAQILAERLDYELAIIAKAGFVDYFLIVWDFIDWARKAEIPVGPGRGSGAGCLVAYALKITDIDPIRFKLLFERFLNPERVSPPDFDIDFCMRRRAEVIEYVRNKYGHDCVANIITFGTFGAKMIMRDLARINDIPYAEADRIAKMIPDELGITLAEAVEKSSELRKEMETTPLVGDMVEQGKIIEGMVRNVGTHAAGVIIGDRPISELVPVTFQDGILTTQYPKDPLEDFGLLKMDFLGLKTLTILADAQTNIRTLHEAQKDFDIEKVSLEDDKTFALLNQAKTIGVFQVESASMQALCRKFNLSSIDEIIALIALYRPGPMEWIPDYLKGKADPTVINYPHPLLETVCQETFGVMLYQEQVMEAARIIAGYSLGSADILRRAMGKKKAEEMEKQRSIFIAGALATNKISEKKAEEIFNILEKFAGYGFNKSHSAAYAILTYRTAYLKANYPVEFMAAVLSAELGNADKVSHFIDECTAMGIPVLGPDINVSGQQFTPIVDIEKRTGSIRFGLAAIKGVGDAATMKILEQRAQHGPFKDFVDFAQRVDGRTVNKRVMECLINSGAFDAFKQDRQHLMDALEAILRAVASEQKDRQHGQASLFDLFGGSNSSVGLDNPFSTESLINTSGAIMPMQEKLKQEKLLLGFYISGHPMNPYKGLDQGISSIKGETTMESLEDHTPFRLCGVVTNIVKKISKQNNRTWAFFQLAGRDATYEIQCFPDVYEDCRDLLEEGELIVVIGKIRKRGGNAASFGALKLAPLETTLPTLIDGLQFSLDPKHPKIDSFLEELGSFIHKNPGMTRVQFTFPLEDQNQSSLLAQIAPSLRAQFTLEFLQKHLVNSSQISSPILGFTLKPAGIKVEEPKTRWKPGS